MSVYHESDHGSHKAPRQIFSLSLRVSDTYIILSGHFADITRGVHEENQGDAIPRAT